MRYLFAHCELDTQRRVMRRGTQQGKLGPKTLQVLCYLLEHADRVVPKQELAEQCWSDRDCNEATIRSAIRAVQRAVGDNTRNPGIIQSYPNLGYRVAVPVTVVSEESGVTAGESQPTETRTEPLEANDTTREEDESTPLQSIPSRPPALTPHASVRRQLTVLFCDLVVSPVRVTRVDPEDYVEVIQACHDACTASLTPFEGHIVQPFGDGLLVYFGYPQAHEDDAQRAVSSALGMLERLAQLHDQFLLNYGVQVTVQIGIHTGLAVANAQWAPAQVEPLAFGEAPSIAVRLHESLAPNTIGISAATYHLVAAYFSCRALGPRSIPGLSESIEVYQVLRRRDTPSRFGAAMLTRGLTPLVGREHEIAFLLAQWDQARSGVGSVVCIRGDAGVGKSRLVQELKEQIAFDVRMLLECQSSPYYQRTAFWPLTQWFEPLCQWERFERPDMKVKKLETALAQFTLPREETLALFADLLSLTSRDGEATLRHMTPHQRRRRMMEALLTILFALAEQGPIVLVLEDVQWADSSTLELLSLLVNQVAGARMLVLLIARSDYNLSLNAQLSISDLRLGPLTNQQVEHMILHLSNGKALPAEVLRQLVAKADGVPLFVEEMTRMVLDSGLVVERGDHYELRHGLQDLAIPSTLHDSLIARLDRLAIGQTTVQLAATIGREFSYDLLRAVATVNESTLQRELAYLVEADLLQQRGLPPDADYTFQHALIQEAAYQALPRQSRRQYHQQIARVLEQDFPETSASQPERLAHHYTEAGLRQQSVIYWQQAAQQALDRLAFFDAEAHAQQGLSVLSTLPADAERFQYELNFQILLCKTLHASGRVRDAEMNRPLQRAYELCEQLGNLSQRFEVLGELGSWYLIRAELGTAHELSEQLLDLARRANDPILLRKAHRDVATALFFLGAQTDAMQHLRQALPDNWEPLPFALTVQHFQIAEAAVRRYQGWSQWLLGYPDQASRALEQARQLSQHNVMSLGVDMFFHLILYQWRRETDTIHTQINALIDLAQEYRLPWSTARARILQGWSLAQQGQQTAGIDLIQRGIADYQSAGAELFLTYFLALLAELYGQTGDIETGLDTISEALTFVRQNDERCWEAELYRLRAELLLQQASPDVAEAEAALQQALSVAREQHVKALELRASTSLARLWRQQGKRHQALHLLEAIYSWFTEGHDTADLIDARTLLDALR